MECFFVLEPEESSENGNRWTTAEPVDPIHLGGSQKCPVCGQPVTGRSWQPPQRLQLASAKPGKWGDFLWASKTAILVSERFKNICQQENLSGISTFSPPVEITRMGSWLNGQFPTPAPIYHLIHVLWGGANQDDEASGLTQKHPEVIRCAYCRTGNARRSQDRIAIQAGTWNGQDVFSPRNAPVPFLVSERFKQVVTAHQLTNAWFIPAEQYAYDENRWGKWYLNGTIPAAAKVEAISAN